MDDPVALSGLAARVWPVVLDLSTTLSIYLLPVILAVTLHEAAHGYVARHFGDLTAFRLGRVSLNPARHIDPVGSVLVPIAILVGAKLLGAPAMLFGWARPVPVNYFALRRPKEHMLWVAAAGPASNLLQAVVWAVLLKLAYLAPASGFTSTFILIADAGVVVNVVLTAINLIPILPLDGGRIAFSLLPEKLANSYGRLERFGLPLLIALILVHVHTGFLYPYMSASYHMIYALLGVQA